MLSHNKARFLGKAVCHLYVAALRTMNFIRARSVSTLLRAQLIQMLYSVRSEQLLRRMEIVIAKVRARSRFWPFSLVNCALSGGGI